MAKLNTQYQNSVRKLSVHPLTYKKGGCIYG